MDVETKDKAITITDLPLEILEKIFLSLKTEDLKRSTEVCKQWNDVISQNTEIMKELPLSLEGSWVRLFQLTNDLTRKFHTIKIENCGDISEKTIKVLQQKAEFVHNLEISDYSIAKDSIKIWSRMLKLFQRLETLQLSYVDTNGISFEAVNLPKLKKVIMHETETILLNSIKFSQLKSLKISESLNETNFLNFLIGQTKLEELALRQVYFEKKNFTLEKIKEINCPLKKLSLMNIEMPLQSDKNCVAFLERFAGSLEMLELAGIFPENFYELIFKKLLKLKSLVVDVDAAPTENSFYHNLRPNRSVKKLHLKFQDKSSKSVEGFIGNMPNVETLVIESFLSNNEILKFASKNLQKLEKMWLKFCNRQCCQGVRLPGVKNLTIWHVRYLTVDDWKAIAKTFPNLETFTVVTSLGDSLNDKGFNVFTKSWKKLRHLRLGTGFKAVKRYFNQMLKNCKNLQTLEIFEHAFSDDNPNPKKDAILRDFKRDGLRFISHDIKIASDYYKIQGIELDGLWRREPIAEEFYDDSDEDDDDDVNFDDSDDDQNDFANFLGAIQQLQGHFDTDDSDDQYIYFDSDGEMQNWPEEPDDYDVFF